MIYGNKEQKRQFPNGIAREYIHFYVINGRKIESAGVVLAAKAGSKHTCLKGRIERLHLSTVSGTNGGGSSEINRNIIATRG